MELKIKTFGITREILGGREVVFELKGKSVSDLRRELNHKHSALIGLKSLFIAVNQQYAADEILLQESDEIALIPPVAGG
jgi:molybdopterin synthase sulfur carrier subunit